MKIYVFYLIVTMLVGYLIYKKTYLGVTIICLLSSMGPLFKLYFPLKNMDFIYILFTLVFFTIIFIKHFSLTPTFFFIFNIIIILSLIQFLITDVNIWQMGLTLLKYIGFPFIAYFSVKYIIKYNINISYVLSIYIIPNLLVFYYRAFVDYSFQGIFPNFTKGTIWFRPSSFNSAIIFGIELASYLCILALTCKNKKFLITMVILSIYPLVMMRCRSSYFILILFFIYYLIEQKLYYKLFNIICASFLFIMFYNPLKGKFPFLSMMFSSPLGYNARLNSMFNCINKFYNQGIITFLFGKGAGAASIFARTRGYDVVYVENVFLTTLYESGTIILSLWIIFNIYVFVKSRINIETRLLSVIIIAVLLTNLIAANLTAVTVSLLYWELIFYNLLKMKKFVIIKNYDI